MKQNALIGLVVIIVVIGGGWYVYQAGGTPGDTSESALGTEGDAKQPVSGVFTEEGTVVDLLKLGKSISCTYEQHNAKMDGSGTVYLDGLNRFRVKGVQTQNGSTFESNIIYTPSTMYMWVEGDGKSFALKVPVKEPITTTNSTSDASLNSTVVYEDVTYTCSAWSVSDSLFTPPTNVTFISAEDIQNALTPKK